MVLVCKNHNMTYEAERLAMLFLSGEKIYITDDLKVPVGDYIATNLVKAQMEWHFQAVVSMGGKTIEQTAVFPPDTTDRQSECHRIMGVLLYTILSKMTGKTPPWGILTGIRPVKLFRSKLEQGMTEEEVAKLYSNQYLVLPQKVKLALETANIEKQILSTNTPQSFSLYVSIPFCPSRCNYCSFVSEAIAGPKAKALVAPYVDKLCEEIRSVAKISKKLGLRLETVYFGGGTPTTLLAIQLKQLCDTIAESFDMSTVHEYTVEAGRPDTIDEDKLIVLKEAGITRISVNPQSLNNEVLKLIGRNHTAEDIVNCFNMARKLGFNNINMDLIAGLEGDTVESFKKTVEYLLKLSPENITIHTLSVKRAAKLAENKEQLLAQDNMAEQMVDYAGKRLSESGYKPYYLYRQKNTLSNLENTGYSKPGFESLYNVFIMDEIQTILAVGAGAVTKLCCEEQSKVQRIYNYKFPFEYVRNFDEILSRQEGITTFYTERTKMAENG